MSGFSYSDERFADLQLLRYRVDGFERLTLRQKRLVYYLSEAALSGRDILWDQNGRWNLRVRRTLESVYVNFAGDRNGEEFRAFEIYMKRVWFSNGIHHHYSCEKLKPGFSASFLCGTLRDVGAARLPLQAGESVETFCEWLVSVLFDASVMPKRVNQTAGEDLVATSSCNYYGEGVTQGEAEAFYDRKKEGCEGHPMMFGLNSKLVKDGGRLRECVWRVGGAYSPAIEHIVYWLEKAVGVAENERQADVIQTLVKYYQTGDLRTFDDYCIKWVGDTDSFVDFTNGFIETYGDPLGLKGSWEGYVNFKDIAASERAERLSKHAQWFEDRSPVDERFKKKVCKGISARVVKAAMLGGDLYPASAIGINLPNSNWIRAEHGSKSVTIGNLTDAYNKAALGNGFREEFVIDAVTLDLMNTYADVCDDLHTDLHECLGHGSGQLLPETDGDALKAYGATVEEARADLFALYYIADEKMLELNLLPNREAYKAAYYGYMMNGLLTQLVRIERGKDIEEAHMRNRALIAHWVLEHGGKERVVELVNEMGKTYVRINDYERLRVSFGELLREVQRIKSEGDYVAARDLVEEYGVRIDDKIHREVLERYEKLRLAPYKGFINPRYVAEYGADGEIADVRVEYGEAYAAQMLRYSRDYGFLPFDNV